MKTPEKVAALVKEITELLAKEAVTVVPQEQRNSGLYSPYFLVPKKTGGMRPILDLRTLNESVAKRPFRMLTTKRLLQCIHNRDFCVSIDLKDAYFHVPVLPRHRKFLSFAFQGVAYEYARMPFGYALAPRTFSKCVETALEPLRRQGIRLLAYLDDLLVLATSAELAITHTTQTVIHLTRLGFAVNWKKSAPWPSQQIVYLGLQIDTVTMRARISDPRRAALLLALRKFYPNHMVTAHSVMTLLGLMSSAHSVVPLGLLHMRKTQRWFAQLRLDPVRHRRRWVTVPLSLRADLNYWRDPCVMTQGVAIGRVSSYIPVYTDACLTGWGGTCQARAVGGVWSQSGRHINLLELETVLLVLTHFVSTLRGHDVLVWSDNRTTVAYINRQGGVRSPALHRLAEELWLWAHEHLRSLTAAHIPGCQNIGADLMSRGGPRDDEWRLHPEIVLQIWERFGRAEVDLFASRVNAQCPIWFSLRAQDEPPLGIDAFAHQWPEVLLYAFPPLSCILPLLARVRTGGLSIILIAPDRPGAPWYAEMMQMLIAPSWPIPHRQDAMSQAAGMIEQWPLIGQPLKVWLLRGTG